MGSRVGRGRTASRASIAASSLAQFWSMPLRSFALRRRGGDRKGAGGQILLRGGSIACRSGRRVRVRRDRARRGRTRGRAAGGSRAARTSTPRGCSRAWGSSRPSAWTWGASSRVRLTSAPIDRSIAARKTFSAARPVADISKLRVNTRDDSARHSGRRFAVSRRRRPALAGAPRARGWARPRDGAGSLARAVRPPRADRLPPHARDVRGVHPHPRRLSRRGGASRARRPSSSSAPPRGNNTRAQCSRRVGSARPRSAELGRAPRLTSPPLPPSHPPHTSRETSPGTTSGWTRASSPSARATSRTRWRTTRSSPRSTGRVCTRASRPGRPRPPRPRARPPGAPRRAHAVPPLVLAHARVRDAPARGDILRPDRVASSPRSRTPSPPSRARPDSAIADRPRGFKAPRPSAPGGSPPPPATPAGARTRRASRPSRC